MTGYVDQAARDALTTARGTPAVVIAGAGSGKTHTLVERIAGELTGDHPLDPGHLAAITFTERAARELVHRLRAKVPGVDLDDAYVGTIHGFCLRILRRFPIEAGLPPVFDAVDELTSSVQATERAAAQDRHLYDAAADDPLLLEALELLARDVVDRHVPRLAEIIDRRWADFDTCVLPNPRHRDELMRAIDARTLPLRRILDHPWVSTADDKLAVALREAVPPWLESVRRDPFTAPLDPTFSPRNVGSDRDWIDHVGMGKTEARLLAQSIMDPSKSHADMPPGPTVGEIVRAEALARVLHHLVPQAVAAAHERIRQGSVNFDDLLVLTRRLLVRHPEVTAEVRAWFRQIYVDEFQDTDDIQFDILTALCAPDPEVDRLQPPAVLFVVGDPKQAIYSFRNARPDILVQLASDAERTHRLVTNFRSRPAICEWINTVMPVRFGAPGQHQPEYELLTPDRTQRSDGPATVTVLGVDADGAVTPHADAATTSIREAADLVAMIRRIVPEEGPPWRIGDGDRAARLGDITILLRNRGPLATLEAALRDAGIPYRIEGGTLLYESREVYELLRVLRAIDNPEDGHKVVTALRTSVFGLSDRQLVAFTKVSRYWSVPSADRLAEAADAGTLTDDAVAVVEALASLRYWSHRVHVTTPAQLLTEIYESTFGAAAARLAEGVAIGETWRRVRFVVDEARRWSDETAGTLGEYLDWVTARIETVDRSEISTDEATDAVRIMTIHAAKGLQFPIVMVAGLGRKDPNEDFVQAAVVGGAPRARMTKSYVLGELADDGRARERAEEARLLYVALTRACDYLVVSFHTPQRADSAAKRFAAALTSEACHHVDVEVFQPAVPDDSAADRPDHPLVAALDPVAEYDPLDPPVRPPAQRHRTWTPSSIAGVIHPDAVAPAETDDPEMPPPDTVVAVRPVYVHEPIDPGLRKDPPTGHLAERSRGRYGTSMGTAVHAVLQDVPLDDPLRDLDRRAASAAADADVPDATMVATLARSIIASDRFAELASAGARREIYVGTAFDPGNGDPIAVWGYIDAVYRRPDGSLVIVDFKTDGSTTSVDTLRERYRHQLSAYAAAVERATGTPVAEAVLLVGRRTGHPAIEVVIDPIPAGDLIAELAAAVG